MKTAGKLVSIFVALLSVPLLAAPPKTGGVQLRLDPATTLPGLPVAFLVTLPVEVVERGMDQVSAVLHVQSSATGETFQAHFDSEATVQGSIDLNVQSLPSHGMIEVQQTVDAPWGPPWFADERFQKPGSYRLRLQIVATELEMPKDFWSSEATLDVREPEGVDAEAWAWLRAQPRGGWKRERWSEDLARSLIEAFPSSEYARYGVGMLARRPRDAAPWLQKAIELSEGTWLADYYRLWLQERRAADSSCGEASSGSVRSSRTELRACLVRVTLDAREKIRSIAAQTSSPSVRHLAESEQRRLKQQAHDLSGVKE